MPTTRVKDAGFLQQNIEKLILGAGVLVLLAAFGLFVFGNPFSIEVGGKSFADAGEAVGVLKSKDSQLEGGLSNTSPLPDTPIPAFLDNYEAMIKQSVVSPGPIPRLVRSGLNWEAMYPNVPEPPRYAMVYPPAPQDIKHKFGTDVLDAEFNPTMVDQFRELMNKPNAGRGGEPFDISMFIAAGDFDIWEWVNRLKGEQDTTTPKDNRIPIGIWAKRFGIAGVVLLREEWDDQSGVWTNRQIVKPLPGQKRVTPLDPAPTNPAEALVNVELLRQAQADIARPELPWLTDTNGTFIQASPPGGEDLLGTGLGFDEFGIGGKEALGRAEQQIVDYEEKIRELEERRRLRDEKERGRERPDRPDRPAPRPRPGGGGFDEGPGFDGGPQPNQNPERSDPIQREIDSLQKKIEDLRPKAEKEREDRVKKQEELRLQEEARRAREEALRAREGALPGFGDEFGAGLGFDGVQVEKGAKVRVWAADPTMMPGKTYRYKLLVAVINPLYAVPRLESEQLAENKARAAILPSEEEIDKMEWIGPVTVEPTARFFFTSGSETRAKVDIYRRHNGLLTKQSFDVAPGDPMGGTVTIKDKQNVNPPVDVDMGLGSVLIDITRRRDLAGNSVLTMIYQDQAGNLYERSQALDANNPDRRVLDREISEGPKWELRPEIDKTQQQFQDGFGGPGFGPGGFNEF